MKTKSEIFVQNKIEKWKQLKSMMTQLSGSFKKLSEKEISEFPRLYRLVCSDLAEAKMLKLSPDVIEYLNALVGKAHQFLYDIPPLKKSQVRHFFKNEYPFVIIRNWQFVLLSFLLFVLPFLITYFLVVNDSDLALRVVPEQVLKQMEESYQESISTQRGAGIGTYALSYYIQHNITIAFFSFAGGILYGLGSIYFLLYNGITLGAITGYVNAIGYGTNFWNFVSAHSVMELTGLILAGAAGLLLGYTLINPGHYKRKDWLKLQRDKIFAMIAVFVSLLVFAAMTEGFISPNPYPFYFKLSITIISSIMILFIFLFVPIVKKRGLNGPF